MNAIVLWAALVAAGMVLGWVAQGWRMGAEFAQQQAEQAGMLRELAEEQVEVLRIEQKKRAVLEAQLSALDNQHYQELQDVQAKNARLAADLSASARRLSVRTITTSCPRMSTTAPAPRLDDAAGTRADLHPAVAANLIRVTGQADQCQAKLTGLQDWVKQVLAAGGRGDDGN